jgi:hypothetical protein
MNKYSPQLTIALGAMILALAAIPLVSCGPSSEEYNRVKAESQQLHAEIAKLNSIISLHETGPSAILARARVLYCEGMVDSSRTLLAALLAAYPQSAQADSASRLSGKLEKTGGGKTPAIVPSGAGAGYRAPAVTAPKPKASRNAGSGETVYITRTGKKYHRAGCSSLSKSCIPMTRSEAEAKGYTPCARCKP